MSFSVTCPTCGKSFQLAQEIYERKVAGKIVSIKCKQCQSGIRIDATTPGALNVIGATPATAGTDSVGAAPPAGAAKKPALVAEPARQRQPTLIGMMSPSGKVVTKSADPPSAPDIAGALWAVDSGSAGEDRELDTAAIAAEIAAGKIDATTLVWRDGMTDWVELSKVPQLAKHLPGAKKAEAPKVAAPLPGVPRAGSAGGGSGVLPPRGKLPSAPIITEAADEEEATMIYRSSPDADRAYDLPEVPAEKTPPPAAPPPAAGRAAAGRQPGAPPFAPPPARPALPAPPAAAAPPPAPPPPPVPTTSAPAAAPPPMRAQQPSAPGYPKGLTPPPPLTAPPAPPPVPSPPPSAPYLGTPFTPTANPYAASGKTTAAPAPPMMAVTPGTQQLAQLAPNPFAVATTTDLDFPEPRKKTGLIIGGIVLVLAAAGVAVAVTSGGARPAPPPVPTAAPVAPAAQTPPTGPTNTPIPDAPTPRKQEDTIAGTAPAATTSGDFSQMFAAGLEKGKKGGPAGTKPFDAEDAKTAVAAALKAVAACKEPGGATGQSSAAVTFEASGSVTSVTVGMPFSGTSVGTCIVSAFKGVKIAPFSGLPGTVTQPVSLQ